MMNISNINTTLATLAINNSSACLNVSCNSTQQPPNGSTTLDPNEYQAYVRIFYILLLIFGSIGNILTCFVILCRSDMRRSIHIYTFNLAATDILLFVLYLPFQMISNENDLKWNMSDGLCRIQYSVVSITLLSTIGTLVAITMDRHRGVTRPFGWRENAKWVAKLAVPAIWIIAIIFSIPIIVVVKKQYYVDGIYCYETWGEPYFSAYWTAMFCIQFLFPLLAIILAHIHIMYRISRDMDSVSSSHHKRMIRMIVVLSLTYTICTAPQHIVFFWGNFGNLNTMAGRKLIFMISNWLVLLQAAINPIIYGTLRQDFKRAFAALFMCIRLRSFLYKQFGVGSNVHTHLAVDASQFHSMHHVDPDKRHLERGLRTTLNIYQSPDTPPLSTLYAPNINMDEQSTPFKLHADSKSSSDSGISNSISANAYKKSVTFSLVPNGGVNTATNVEQSERTDKLDSSSCYPTFFDKEKSASTYDELERDEQYSLPGYDFEELLNEDSKETKI